MRKNKFNIYVRESGQVMRLHKFIRTPSGLYTIGADPPGFGRGNHDSYHEDGNSWSRRSGSLSTDKYIRQPLSSFTGAETLSVGLYSFFNPLAENPHAALIKPRPEDIVIELEGMEGSVGVEVILSDSADLELSKLPERANRAVYVKDWKPALVVEVFKPVGRFLPSGRFPRREGWVEGVTWFPDHHGRI